MQFSLSTLDILYLSLSVGFLALVYFLVQLIKRVHMTLDKLDPVLENVNDTTGDIRHMKDGMKRAFWGTASTVLGMMVGKKR